MEKYLKTSFDFSMLDENDLKNVSEGEIIEVYGKQASRLHSIDEISVHANTFIMIGFTARMKPVTMIFDFETDKVRLQTVSVATEFELSTMWCTNFYKN